MPPDNLDFLEKESTPAPEVNSGPQPAPDTSPLPPVHVEPAAVEPTKKPPWTAAMALDEREKRQKLEAKYEALERKYAEATNKPAAKIDMFADPEAWERSFDQKLEATKWETKTAISLEMATEKYGAQVLQDAQEAVTAEMEKNPAFFQTIQGQRHPYDFVVKWHKRQQAMSKLGDDDPETWFEKQAKERGYILTSQPQGAGDGSSSPQQSTPLPRASLASAPSASGNIPKTPIGNGVAFDEAFKR